MMIVPVAPMLLQPLSRVFIAVLSFLVTVGPTSFGQDLAPQPCETEVIRPNLTVAHQTDIEISMRDPSGAPFEGGYELTLRDGTSRVELVKAHAKAGGVYRFSEVPAGTYRLVLYTTKNGEASRPPGFDQARNQICGGEQACHLDITLAIHGTDLPYEFCPPK